MDPNYRTIFPVTVNAIERQMLTALAKDAGMSRSEVVRILIMREMAAKQIAPKAIVVKGDR